MAEHKKVNKIISVIVDDFGYPVECDSCIFNNTDDHPARIDCDKFAKRITGIDCMEQNVHFLAVDYKGDIQNEHTN